MHLVYNMQTCDMNAYSLVYVHIHIAANLHQPLKVLVENDISPHASWRVNVDTDGDGTERGFLHGKQHERSEREYIVFNSMSFLLKMENAPSPDGLSVSEMMFLTLDHRILRPLLGDKPIRPCTQGPTFEKREVTKLT